MKTIYAIREERTIYVLATDENEANAIAICHGEDCAWERIELHEINRLSQVPITHRQESPFSFNEEEDETIQELLTNNSK